MSVPDGSPGIASPPREASATVIDPLSLLLNQRSKKSTTSAPASPSTAAAAGTRQGSPPSPGSGQPNRGKSNVESLFDVESSLGRDVSSRHGHAGAITGDSADTAMRRIERALAPGSNVDFPTVADISERVLAVPEEATQAVRILVGAFSDERTPPRRRLKALTIMNELAYDARAAEELRARPDLLPSLRRLQAARNTGLGEAADAQIRMFATELQRRCLDDRVAPSAGACDEGESGSAGQLPDALQDVKANFFAAGLAAQAASAPLLSAALGGLADAMGKMQEQALSVAPYLAAATEGFTGGAGPSEAQEAAKPAGGEARIARSPAAAGSPGDRLRDPLGVLGPG